MKGRKLVLLLSTIGILSACHIRQDPEVRNMPAVESMCMQYKHELSANFNSPNSGPTFNPITAADVYKKYQRYECSRMLRD